MFQHRVFVNCRLILPATAKHSRASELWHWSCGEKFYPLALLLLNINHYLLKDDSPYKDSIPINTGLILDIMLSLDAIKYLIYVLFILAFLIFIFMSASPIFGAPPKKNRIYTYFL